MTAAEIEAIEARAKAATEGPWVCHLGQPDEMPANTCRCRSILAEPYQGAVGEVHVDNGKAIADGGNDCPPEAEARANARFLSAARADVPALVAEVRRLRAVVKSLEWGSCDGCGTRRHCTECKGNSDGRYDTERDEWVTTPFHEATCPVFTPDGQVR